MSKNLQNSIPKFLYLFLIINPIESLWVFFYPEAILSALTWKLFLLYHLEISHSLQKLQTMQ